jgi:hypothetical protein
MIVWLRCSRRSRIAAARTSSPNTAPHLRDELVGRDECACLLISLRHELKEEMSTAALEGQIAEFVDHEELGLRVKAKSFVEMAFSLCTGECR